MNSNFQLSDPSSSIPSVFTHNLVPPLVLKKQLPGVPLLGKKQLIGEIIQRMQNLKSHFSP
jgi:hypothetical protein